MNQTIWRRLLTCLAILSALAGNVFAQADAERAYIFFRVVEQDRLGFEE